MKNFFSSIILIGVLVPASYAQGVRLVISNGNQSDTAHFHFNGSAAVGFDNSCDLALNLQSGNGHNYIYSDDNGTALRRNNVPLADSSYTVPVGMFIQSPGNVSLTLEAEPSFPAGTRFSFETQWTGPVVDLAPGVPVQLFVNATNIGDPAAYALHVYPTPTVTTLANTCFESQDGALQVSFGRSRGWILNVYDSAPTLLYSMMVSGHDTLISGLGADNYSIAIGGPEFYAAAAPVTAPAQLDATFTLPSDSLTTGQLIPLTNNAATSVTSAWDFGDNSGIYYGHQPTYLYTLPGSYIITQTVTSAAGCTATFGHKVTVVQGLTTGIAAADAANDFSITTNGSQVTIRHNNGSAPYHTDIFTTDGKLVDSFEAQDEVSTTLPVNTIYYIRTQLVEQGVSFTKTIFVNGQ